MEAIHSFPHCRGKPGTLLFKNSPVPDNHSLHTRGYGQPTSHSAQWVGGQPAAHSAERRGGPTSRSIRRVGLRTNRSNIIQCRLLCGIEMAYTMHVDAGGESMSKQFDDEEEWRSREEIDAPVSP